jgi:DNA anti-recombination protein RmuC
MYGVIQAEVSVLPENDHNALAAQVRQAREQFREKLRAQAERLETLQQALKELREEHERLESETERHFGGLEEFKLPSPPLPLEAVLAAVGNLITATLPKQVFNKLTEEACRMGVRAVVFEVRSKADYPGPSA